MIPIHFAPLQGYTDDVYRRIHHQLIGGVDCYYTPFIRIEGGGVRSKDLRDIEPAHNEGVPVVPQIILKSLKEFDYLVKVVEEKGYKEIDLNILRKSLDLLSLRHQVLKTAFTVLKSSGAIKQVILENRKPEFSVLEQNCTFSQNVLDKILAEKLNKPLDLQKDSLFKVTIVDFTDNRFMLKAFLHFPLLKIKIRP